MRDSMLLFDPQAIDLDPEPINPEWIVRGAPSARSKKLVTSRDWMGTMLVWDCTVGDFRWHYDRDEIIYLLAGEAFVSTGTGTERRLKAGDLVYFPAGFVCNWRITQPVRKFAVLKEAMWSPLGRCAKLFNKLLRVLGLAGKPSSPPIVEAFPLPADQEGQFAPKREAAAAAAAGASGTAVRRPSNS